MVDARGRDGAPGTASTSWARVAAGAARGEAGATERGRGNRRVRQHGRDAASGRGRERGRTTARGEIAGAATAKRELKAERASGGGEI